MWRIAGSNPIALKGSANFETRQHQCDSPEEFRPSKPTRYSLSRVPITDCVRHMESAYIVCGHEASPCLSYQQHTYTIIAIFDGLMTFLQLHSTLPGSRTFHDFLMGRFMGPHGPPWSSPWAGPWTPMDTHAPVRGRPWVRPWASWEDPRASTKAHGVPRSPMGRSMGRPTEM